MNRYDFNAILAQFKTFMPAHRQRAGNVLQTDTSEPQIPARVREREELLNRDRTCIHCHAEGALKNGKVAGLSRFRYPAEGCKRSCTALTGAQLSRLRFKDKWEAHQDCLRQRRTLEQAATQCGISKTRARAFKWRHRFIAEAATRMPLEGVVEMDETYFLESEKGSRTLRQRRKPRRRDVRKRGRDSSGDAHPSYGIASNNLRRRHEVVNRRRDRYARDSTSHLNTVYNRHEVMKSILNQRHRGVATKYLDNYMNWIQRQEFRPDKRVNTDFLKDHSTMDTHWY